ncbi:SMC family ATPase [Streptomyces tubbatahanensis]|uniref:Nuclease SbcCD subunit C n=1 Tax=Streptomyces tubbatahanensis TaxID=2923272 RepID=A0ABY3XMN1_9ACTN|nr:SMC family ATPase [Streptomyces tubbatahanensis]UNS95692.1 SMC family ATPase [Streptomyces tubbatahanensis]
MRLHRLTLTAFGPFGGTHTVDFDALSAAGLFLLHGATGAGKTSVLDAVCFALYGSVPGARQQPGGTLRSDHAPRHTLTEVVLELTVAGRRLEITRAPEQLRPKARGSGLTRERARSELRAWDTDTARWRGLSRSHQEIGEEIGQALGMSKDQFCQVVLLPQGDFARFLRAGAEDRAKLLGRLFDTGRFAAVEEQLAQRRKAAQHDVVTADEELLALAHRMRQAVGDPAELSEGPGATAAPAGPVSVHGSEALPGQRAGTAALASRSPGVGRTPAGAKAARGAKSTGRGAKTAGRGARTPLGGAEPAERPAFAPGDAGLADAVLAWAAQARCHARERLTSAALAAETARERHSTALQRWEETRELARAQDRFARARQRADELAAAGAEHDALRQRLESAYAAEAVAPALRLHDTARDEHARAEAAERNARSLLPETLADAPCERLSALERETGQELGALGAAREEEPRVAGIEAEVRRLDAESRADEELLGEAEEWLAGWEERRHALQRRADDAQEAATRAERLAALLHPARARLKAARRRDAFAAEIETAVEALQRAREQAAEAKERWLALRERRLRGIAAELAANLAAGEPCAVCGSPEHPAPAREAADHVDRASEEEALAASQRAGEARESARQRLAALRDSHTTAATEAAAAPAPPAHSGAHGDGAPAREEAASQSAGALRADAVTAGPEGAAPANAGPGGVGMASAGPVGGDATSAGPGRTTAPGATVASTDAPGSDASSTDVPGSDAPSLDAPSVEALAGVVAELESAHARAHAQAGTAHQAREALAAAEREFQERSVARQDGERRAAGRVSTRDALQRERASLIERLDRARGEAPSVAARYAQLERRAALLSGAAQAAQTAEGAATRLAEARAHLAEAARQAGFATAGDAARAVLPASEQRGLRERLERRRVEEAAVREELADPVLVAAAARPPAEPERARAAAEEAEEGLRAAEAAHHAASGRVEALDELGGRAVATARRVAPLRTAYDRLARLAGLTAGTSAENERRMRLESYVLAARLEQVAEAASARLERMSDGRYTLVHSGERTGGRGRSGLGLHVVDAWTGAERDTATLSGGETFFASLALALGLADVVTDEAGGSRLETLFIDEGFGSLDEQTLDEVLDVLDSLRERDRCVGIVSHVADLRQRIPAQLEVVKSRAGSAVRHHTAPVPG